MRVHHWIVAGAIALAPLPLSQGAQAATVTGTAAFFDLGPSGNGLNFIGTFNPSSAFNLNLTYGTPVTLNDFLTITAVDTNYNLLSTATDTIKTTFSFTAPSAANGAVTGTGTDTSLFFVFDGGNIHWNGPANVSFANGLDLSITLSDASFFGALGGLGSAYPSVAIDATFSLTGSNVSQAPLPAALPLFATGLGAMGLFGWWRKKRQQAVATVAI